ncbi:unnamed protein product [Discosporangium mesarthrocarpum]
MSIGGRSSKELNNCWIYSLLEVPNEVLNSIDKDNVERVVKKKYPGVKYVNIEDGDGNCDLRVEIQFGEKLQSAEPAASFLVKHFKCRTATTEAVPEKKRSWRFKLSGVPQDVGHRLSQDELTRMVKMRYRKAKVEFFCVEQTGKDHQYTFCVDINFGQPQPSKGAEDFFMSQLLCTAVSSTRLSGKPGRRTGRKFSRDNRTDHSSSSVHRNLPNINLISRESSFDADEDTDSSMSTLDDSLGRGYNQGSAAAAFEACRVGLTGFAERFCSLTPEWDRVVPQIAQVVNGGSLEAHDMEAGDEDTLTITPAGPGPQSPYPRNLPFGGHREVIPSHGKQDDMDVESTIMVDKQVAGQDCGGVTVDPSPRVCNFDGRPFNDLGSTQLNIHGLGRFQQEGVASIDIPFTRMAQIREDLDQIENIKAIEEHGHPYAGHDTGSSFFC